MSDFATRLDEQSVQFVRLLPGPIERVWSYLADSDRRREWLGAGQIPAKLGDSFTLEIKHADYWPGTAPPDQRAVRAAHTSLHVLLALEPPHLLAYSFQPEGWEETKVEFRLAPQGDKVRLTLIHTKLGSRGHAVDVSHGWHGHLDILQRKLEGEPLPPFDEVWRKGRYEQRYN